VIDLCGLAILAFYVLMGAHRGGVASALRIACPLLAYAAAFLGAPLIGPLLARWLDLPRPLGLPLGGALLFVVVLIGAGVAAMFVRERLGQGGTWPRDFSDRVGGALVGVAHGAVMLLLLGVVVSFLDGMRVSGATDWLNYLPQTDSSKLVSMSQSALERTLPLALGDSGPAARVTTEFLAHPGETVERFQQVLGHPRIEALQRDRLFWSYVERNAVDQALNQASFLGVAHDPTLRTELADLGLVSEDARADPGRFQLSAGEALRKIGPRIQRVRRDPAFQALARDPEIQRALAEGDTFQLLRHPDFRALITRALDEE